MQLTNDSAPITVAEHKSNSNYSNGNGNVTNTVSNGHSLQTSTESYELQPIATTTIATKSTNSPSLGSIPGPSTVIRSLSHSTVSLQLIYRDVSYTVKVPENPKSKKLIDKPILKSVRGVFEPGRFTAVMGASGAGKTSLLNVLAGRPNAGTVSGDIRINNIPLSGDEIKKLSAFVHQEDIIMATATVREAIRMSALLRLPSTITVNEKLNRVEEVIDLLHLRQCADSIIGSATQKGISGGERRRVSLGMEMITNPGILFLDEPTSGLDTFTAHSVCELLSTVAHQQGRTVIATIHQPSSDIFHMFDDLVLMAAGEIMYSGPALGIIDYFNRLNYHCPKYTNPADFMFMKVLYDETAMKELQSTATASNNKLKQIKIESNNTVTVAASAAISSQLAEQKQSAAESRMAAEKDRVAGLVSLWKTSTASDKLELIMNNPHTGPIPTAEELDRGGSGIWIQLILLYKRAWYNMLRNKLGMANTIIQGVIMSVFIGLVFLRIGTDQRSIQDRAGSLFFAVVMGLFGAMSSILNVFHAEKQVFIREYCGGMYSIHSYFWSRYLVELPLKLIAPIVCSAIQYFMIGYQNNSEKFWIYTSVVTLSGLAGSAIGMCVSCAFADLQTVIVAAPVFFLPMILFSGLYINLDSIPNYFRWLSYLSPARFSFTAVVRNEFSGLELYCTPNQLNDGNCTYTRGEPVIDLLGAGGEPSMAGNIWILFGLVWGYLLWSLYLLWRSTKGKA